MPSVCHRPGDSDAITALGVTSLSHISLLPLAAGWSLSQCCSQAEGVLGGALKGVKVSSSCCCQELHTHGQGWERSQHQEPRWGCPQSVDRALGFG